MYLSRMHMGMYNSGLSNMPLLSLPPPLQDYVEYLQAAGEGHPSVFTTRRETMLEELTPQQQQQKIDPETLTEYQEACYNVTMEAELLLQLPTHLLQRPGHMSVLNLVQLAAAAELDSIDEVKEILEGFYDLKRKGFREVLDELLSAAGSEAVSSRARF